MEIDKETYDQIAELIHSNESPVGIDAKKTHILILHKLAEIENDWTLWKSNPNQKESDYVVAPVEERSYCQSPLCTDSTFL